MPFIQTRRFASMICVCAFCTPAGAQEPLFRQLRPERQLSAHQEALVESGQGFKGPQLASRSWLLIRVFSAAARHRDLPCS
jgi:hypothetical protein